MADQKHIINKQVLEIKVDSKKEAHLIQDAFSKAYKTHIIPTFERIANRFTQNGEIIQIEKLIIDVGDIKINNLNSDFPQLFEKNLEDKLIQVLHEKKRENILLTSDIPNSLEKIEKSLSIKTVLEENQDILCHFLQIGTMPWWSSKNIRVIVEELLDRSPEKISNILLKLLNDCKVRKRFLYQFPANIINKTVYALIPGNASLFLDFIEKIKAVQTIHPFINLSQSKFNEEILNSTFEYIIEKHDFLKTNPQNEIEILNHILSKLINQEGLNNLPNNELFKLLSKVSESINFSKQKIHGISKYETIINTLLNQLDESPNNKKPISVTAINNSQFDLKAKIEIFSIFLKTGKIFYSKSNYPVSSIQVIADEILINSPDDLKIVLLTNFKEYNARKLFIQHFSDEFIFKIIEILVPLDANLIIELIEKVYQIKHNESFNNTPTSNFREDIWNLIINHIANNYQSNRINFANDIESIRSIIANYLHKTCDGKYSINEIQERFLSTNKNELFEKKINNSISSNITSNLEQQKKIKDNTESISIKSKTLFKKIDIEKEENQNIDIKKVDILKRNNYQQKNNNKSEEIEYLTNKSILHQLETESLYVNNAGLCLLWPFLNIFFVKLNIVKDKKFISNEAAQRAIHLIQYLLTEKEETPEHELIFNKLLCGIDIYEPIPLGIKITDAEKEECNALLQSVIDNWTVLKSTSIQGLRSTFLQREGIISKQANGWKLTIERTAVDILLDRLPWSISLIALPWCKEMIYVEW